MSYILQDYTPVQVHLTVNGQEYDMAVPPHLTLLELLREELHLTGVKCGCDDSNCGACTVLINGQPFKSCCTLVAQVNGKRILTIEGLAQNGVLHPMQQAFIDHFALQCGFCTPAMILTAISILEENPEADEDAVREGLHGNICRCTGYQKIVEAILAVRNGEYADLQKRWEEQHTTKRGAVQ